MENQNDGASSGIGKMFSDYEKSHKKKGYSNTNSNSGFAKYFMPTESKETFRILPPKKLPNGNDREYVEFAFFHSVQTNMSGGKKKWRKLYCKTHNDPRSPKLDANGQPIVDKEGKPVLIKARCPLCEKSAKLLAAQDPSLKGIKPENYTPQQKLIREKNNEIYKDAMKWEAKKFYIVRGIDQGQPKDGVKFWRFKHNFKKQGIYDKLTPALRMFYEDNNIDFTDVDKGTDLIITVVDNQIPGSNRTFRDVSSIMSRGSSQLHSDPIVVQQWLNDDITWRDVFKEAKTRVLTSEEYMERVARGVDPYWDDSDSTNKRWIFPDPSDIDFQTRANTRDENLDADVSDNYEVASDVVIDSYQSNANINTIKKEDVGTFKDDAIELTTQVAEPVVNTTPAEAESVDNEDAPEEYEDLPF